MEGIRKEIADVIKVLSEGMACGECFENAEGQLRQLVALAYRDCLEIAKDYTGQGVAIAGLIREHMDNSQTGGTK